MTTAHPDPYAERPALAPTRLASALSVLLGAAAFGSACAGPRVVQERPVLVTGERVPPVDGAALGAGAAADQRALAAGRDSIAAAAAAGCPPATCASIARGELALGMSETQLLAATRTTPAAWSARRAGSAATLVPASAAAPPADAVGEVAMVQLTDGRVTAIGYREPQGVRVVQRAEDATTDGRAGATAEALVREGDAFNAAGDRAAALDRYDRALVLRPDDAMLQYRVATLLDLQLRPVEALMRYQRFLQTLELQRIDAVGNANAKLAEAIARAQQRILILERQSR